MQNSPERDASALYDFLLALQEDLAEGRVAPVESYIQRFPGLDAEVRLEYSRALNPRLESGGAPEPQRRIGNYLLLRPLGRGGQGEVYLALDESLGRRVALKVLTSPLGLVSADRRARFRREAQVVAQLNHPGVCTIYEADLDAELPYIAMPLVDGQSLGELIKDAKAGGPSAASLPCRPTTDAQLERVLEYFEQVAHTLHAAHGAGVIHRDVKPGNLMVTQAGRAVVVDFGLARADDPAQATLTKTDEVFGTLFYMAPEQLDVGRKPVDARTDIYALGATLYEALTLSPPFERNGWPAMCRAIQHDPVPDARLWNSALPRSMHAILATAMDKDPRRRYASAAEFADDLARARTRMSVLAQAPGRALRAARWARRSPIVAAGLVLALVAIGLGAGWIGQYRRVTDAGHARDSERLAAFHKQLAQEAAGRNTALALREAYKVWNEKPAEGEALFVTILDDLWEERRIRASHEARQSVLDVHAARDLALTGDVKGRLKFWRISDGANVEQDPVQEGKSLVWAAFDPTAELAASASADGLIRLWWPLESANSVVLGRHEGAAFQGAFQPDGELLATCGRDGRARLWDVSQRVEFAALEHDELEVYALTFAPRGEWLITASRAVSGATNLHQWDVASLECVRSWEAHAAALQHIAFQREGLGFMTASDDGSVKIWSAQSPGELLGELKHGAPVRHFDFDPSGERLVVAHDQNPQGHAITVWNLATRSVQLQIALKPGADAKEVRVSPAGDRICVLSSDQSLQLHSLESGHFERRMLGHQEGAVGFRWARAGERILSASSVIYLHTWYARDRPFLRRVELCSSALVGMEFCGENPRVRLTNRAGEDHWLTWPELEPAQPGPEVAALAHTRSALADENKEGTFASRITREGSEVRVVQDGDVWRIEREDCTTHSLQRRQLDFAPARALIGLGGEVAVVGKDGWTIQLFDRHLEPRGKPWPESTTEFHLVAFSADGNSVVSDARDGTLKRWSVKTGELLLKYPHEARITALAFSPDDQHILVALEDGSLKVWPVELSRTALVASPWYDGLLGPWDRGSELLWHAEPE